MQEINNYTERNVAKNLKFQQKLASVCLFEALSKRRGRLDWNVLICDFIFPSAWWVENKLKPFDFVYKYFNAYFNIVLMSHHKHHIFT
jgi:hypothetical protein